MSTDKIADYIRRLWGVNPNDPTARKILDYVKSLPENSAASPEPETETLLGVEISSSIETDED